MMCPSCPRRARGLPGPCRAETIPLPVLCARVAAGERRYDRMLCDDPDPRPIAAAAVVGPGAVPDPADLQAAEGCIHRDPGAGCCPATTCELARRRVTILDCLACIRDRDLDVQSGQLTVAIPQVIVVQ